MLERIVLAAIITFCIYLFLNLGSKSSNTQSLKAKEVTPKFTDRTALFSR